jgi:D-sedoheptulose 7-phosphate isomerase
MSSRATNSSRELRAAIAASLAEATRLAGAAGEHTETLVAAVNLVTTALKGGGRVFFCGNGGSAAQAGHLACELSGRFYYDRPPLSAVSLCENTAALTAIANDYGYEHVFARQLSAFGGAGDVLVALTTSGRSPNMVRAIEVAHALGIRAIGLTGERGQDFASLCDLAFVVRAADTARIQEIHLLLGHVLCAEIEAELFPPTSRPGRP